MLTLAQITDVHICMDDDSRRERAEARLRQTLRAIMALKPRPFGVIASGDLTDRGEQQAYARFWDIIGEETDLPVYAALGNHDLRANFLASSNARSYRANDGFLQYTVDLPEGLRLVVGDTLDEGHAGGGFCEARAGWLQRTLDEAPDRPVLLALHHPPIQSGIGWMDPPLDAPWLARLAQALEGRTQVRAIACGHLHRAFSGVFAGAPVVVAPATDIQLTLDLTAVDPKRPDGREILVEEPPGFALHLWRDGRLITHFCVAGPYPPAVTFDFPLHTD